MMHDMYCSQGGSALVEGEDGGGERLGDEEVKLSLKQLRKIERQGDAPITHWV